MIILDTNVLSALMRHQPDPVVAAWLDGLPAESVWTTSITVFEIRFGLALLVTGSRRRRLEEAFAQVIEEDLQGRILSFDPAAAEVAATLAAKRQTAGRPVEIRDIQIAGITTARKAILATRNVRHFDGLGLSLVDPWALRRSRLACAPTATGESTRSIQIPPDEGKTGFQPVPGRTRRVTGGRV